jgi:hypothetical protein
VESSDASAKELYATGKQRLMQGWKGLLIVNGNVWENNLDYEGRNHDAWEFNYNSDCSV